MHSRGVNKFRGIMFTAVGLFTLVFGLSLEHYGTPLFLASVFCFFMAAWAFFDAFHKASEDENLEKSIRNQIRSIGDSTSKQQKSQGKQFNL